MDLLYISYSYYFEVRDGIIFSMPAYGIEFWKKYLAVFDSITIVGEPPRKNADISKMIPIIDSRIKMVIIPENINPKDFKNDSIIKSVLNDLISNAQGLLIQPTSRKGIMAIQIAKKYHKKYMLEFTGDLRQSLLSSGSFLKRIYSPILHRKILNAIWDADYGLYVTKKYLQKVYPIKGVQCGCTDTNISAPREDILQVRIDKIKQKNDNKIILGLIGAYSGNRKGIDTAIKAVALSKNNGLELHILGLGTEEDKQRWLNFAKKYGVLANIYFDNPLSTTAEVFLWIDKIDICILPSRSEGLPRCIVESNSRACPAITSNVCGLQELVDKKWTHNPGDYKELSKLIDKMVSDKSLMIEAAKNNYFVSKQYTFEQLSKTRNDFLLMYKNSIK